MPRKKPSIRARSSSPAVSGAEPAKKGRGPLPIFGVRTDRLAGWRLWMMHGMLAAGLPALFLCLVELILRGCGMGYPTGFLLKTDGGKEYVENARFASQFYGPETALRPNPLRLAARKPERTLRVCLLGESAAAGTPDPSYGFCRILEVMLRNQYPGVKIEMINAAMRGVNSHIILPIARDCARLKPDLFILYMGNNEVTGLHEPSPTSGPWATWLPLLRWVQWVKATRWAQLAQPLVSRWAREKETRNQDMAYFRERRLAFDDPRRRAVYDNFRANLEDICRVARDAGAKVILSTVAVNLKDFPPFASMHRRDLTEADRGRWEASYAAGVEAEAGGRMTDAVAHYLKASEMDDHYADLQYRLARCYWGTGQFESARTRYLLARDWDALEFRADSRINDAIRQTAMRGQPEGRLWFDAEQALSESGLSDHRIPGERLFYEYVHFRWDGDYQMARALFPVVVKALAGDHGSAAPVAAVLSKEDCARALAYNVINELQMISGMLQLTGKPPFLDQLEHAQRQAGATREYERRAAALTARDLERALETHRAAIAQNPGDWWLYYNYGMLYQTGQDYARAAAQLEQAVSSMPQLANLRVAWAGALARTGQRDAALRQIHEALRIDPQCAPARQALAGVAVASADKK